jgi:hypothetical protein
MSCDKPTSRCAHGLSLKETTHHREPFPFFTFSSWWVVSLVVVFLLRGSAPAQVPVIKDPSRHRAKKKRRQRPALGRRWKRKSFVIAGKSSLCLFRGLTNMRLPTNDFLFAEPPRLGHLRPRAPWALSFHILFFIFLILNGKNEYEKERNCPRPPAGAGLRDLQWAPKRNGQRLGAH